MQVELPDWYNDSTLTPHQAECLMELDELRLNDPILHTLVMGTRTVANMTKLIGWPHDHILWQLREYKGQGLVIDGEGRKAVLWYMTAKIPNELWELKSWVDLERQSGGLFNRNDKQG